jgi:hypothetical protein
VDLALFLRVLWRFRFLVVAGLIVALALAFFSFIRVSVVDGSPRFAYREKETYESWALLFVTQPGFPWGRSVISEEQQPQQVPQPQQEPAVADNGKSAPTTAPADTTPRFADPSRFATLAVLYATLATGDPVREIMLREGPIDGEIEASPVLSSEMLSDAVRSQVRFADALPLVRITGRADTPAVATALAGREIDAFLQFLKEKARSSGIPRDKRVTVTVLEQPSQAELVKGRPMLYPALVFLGVMGATILLAFALENLRPRPSPAEAVDRHLAAVPEATRQSA